MGAMKFVVALGAVVALAGSFLPLSKAAETMKADVLDAVKKLDAKTGGTFAANHRGSMGGGMFGSMTGTFFDMRALPGPGMPIVFSFLGAAALVLIFALLGVAKGYTRGLAVGSLIFSLVPAGLAVLLLMAVNKHGGGAIGSFLMIGGSLLAFIGAVMATIKPEAKKV